MSAPHCFHCGGSFIDRVEDVVCVTCGRPMGHRCELCQFVELPKPATVTAAKAPRPTGKGKTKTAAKGKRTGAAR